MLKLRADRLISVTVVHPALKLVNQYREPLIPILMYHGIRNHLSARRPYFETNTSPKMFAAQMQFLRDNGYKTVSLNETVDCIKTDGDNQKRVAITFDDGYLDFYTDAFPTLSQHGFTATMFAVSGFTHAKAIRSADREFMTWSQLREIHRHGMEIGSHTVTHPELWRLSQRELEYELMHSKKTIEGALGEPIRSFSHPFALPEQNKEFIRTLCTLLRKHGYENGVSTIIGTVGSDHMRYLLPRLPINSHDDANLFRAKLEGAYDWLRVAQRVYKLWLKRPSREPKRLGQAVET